MGLCCCGALAPYGPIELPDKIVRIDQVTRSEAVAVGARSFAGTATTDPEGALNWLLGPRLAEKWDDPRRLNVMSWFLELALMVQLDRKGGFALGARKGDGSLEAVIIVSDESRGMSNETVSFFRDLVPSLWKLGLGPLNANGDATQGIQARSKALEVVEKIHRRHQSGPHFYVNIMAVDPDSQGMGLCGLLMRFVNSLADDLKLPLYLETCGPKNEAIYKRFGYETVEQFTISCPWDPDQSVPHEVNAMIRPAACASGPQQQVMSNSTAGTALLGQ